MFCVVSARYGVLRKNFTDAECTDSSLPTSPLAAVAALIRSSHSTVRTVTSLLSNTILTSSCSSSIQGRLGFGVFPIPNALVLYTFSKLWSQTSCSIRTVRRIAYMPVVHDSEIAQLLLQVSFAVVETGFLSAIAWSCYALTPFADLP
jgi:hypothetical protein